MSKPLWSWSARTGGPARFPPCRRGGGVIARWGWRCVGETAPTPAPAARHSPPGRGPDHIPCLVHARGTWAGPAIPAESSLWGVGIMMRIGPRNSCLQHPRQQQHNLDWNMILCMYRYYINGINDKYTRETTSLPYFGVKLSCVSLMFAYRKK